MKFFYKALIILSALVTLSAFVAVPSEETPSQSLLRKQDQWTIQFNDPNAFHGKSPSDMKHALLEYISHTKRHENTFSKCVCIPIIMLSFIGLFRENDKRD